MKPLVRRASNYVEFVRQRLPAVFEQLPCVTGAGVDFEERIGPRPYEFVTAFGEAFK